MDGCWLNDGEVAAVMEDKLRIDGGRMCEGRLSVQSHDGR